jgi:hypothetical protein
VLTLFYLAAFATLSGFTFMVFDKGLLRHTGAFFILFIIAYWIFRYNAAANFKINKILQTLFILMLSLQTISAIIMHTKDIRYQFSGAKNAAAFLKETNRDTGNILLHPDFYGMSVVHYTNVPKVFYSISKSWGSFIKFNDTRKPRKLADIYRDVKNENIHTMIFNSKLSDSVATYFGVNLLYAPAYSSAVEGEDFFIYGKKSR